MKVTTAAELDQMTMAERQAHFASSVVRDVDDVPEAFLDTVRSRLRERIGTHKPAE